MFFRIYYLFIIVLQYYASNRYRFESPMLFKLLVTPSPKFARQLILVEILGFLSIVLLLLTLPVFILIPFDFIVIVLTFLAVFIYIFTYHYLSKVFSYFIGGNDKDSVKSI